MILSYEIMIVADTNVIVAWIPFQERGLVHTFLKGMLTGELRFAASPAVVLEYEDA